MGHAVRKVLCKRILKVLPESDPRFSLLHTATSTSWTVLQRSKEVLYFRTDKGRYFSHLADKKTCLKILRGDPLAEVISGHGRSPGRRYNGDPAQKHRIGEAREEAQISAFLEGPNSGSYTTHAPINHLRLVVAGGASGRILVPRT